MRPAYQLGEYANFSMNLDDIIEQFCVNKSRPKLNCNGKCYLADQLKIVKNTTDADSTKDSGVLINAFFPLYFENFAFAEAKLPPVHPSTDYFFYTSNLYSVDPESIDPPPKLRA